MGRSSRTLRIGSMLQSHFSRKWGVESEVNHERVEHALADFSGGAPARSDADVVDAFAAVRRPSMGDGDGVALAAAALVVGALPFVASECMRGLVSSTSAMRSQDVHAVPLGKHSGSPLVSKVRVLLPLGSVLTVADILLSRALHDVCSRRRLPDGYWERAVARERNSASYVEHAARLLIEKGLDSASELAALQSDIATFYDQVDVVKAVQSAVSDGLLPSLAPAAVRHQLMPRVMIGVRGAEPCPIEGHTVGAFRTCREYLRHAWRLELPIESTCVLVPRGAPVRPAELPCVTGMRFLGHWLEDTASSLPCWRRARDAAAAAAHMQLRACRRARVPVGVRLRLLDTIILPMLPYSASSWAPSVQLLDEVARFQRRCVASALVVPMYPLEDPIAYRRRRGRAAGDAARGRVQWADQVLQPGDRPRECIARRAAPRAGRTANVDGHPFGLQGCGLARRVGSSPGPPPQTLGGWGFGFPRAASWRRDSKNRCCERPGLHVAFLVPSCFWFVHAKRPVATADD